MNSLPSCKSEVSPTFVLLSPHSLSSRQKLVWVSRLGWPRTKISETHFFPESISKLIIWSGDLVMSWLGDKWKEGNIGPSIIPSDRRPGEIGPVFVLPMMSYADNEAWGNTLARTQCALHMCVFRRPPPDAPRHHLSLLTAGFTNNTHEAIFRSHRSFRSLAELWVISSQSP